jgi:copper resistance protein B
VTRPLTTVLRTLLLSTALLLPRTAQAQSSPATPAHDEHAGHAQQAGVVPEAGQSAAGEHSHPALPAFIPVLTDADRRAAFPDLGGHSMSNPIRTFVLVERLEWQASAQGSDAGVHVVAWVGRERNRLWLRGEGAREDGRTEEAQAHVLWGRQITRWWDVVAGIRQDLEPGDAQTWAAVGVQGLAPYWFDIEATGYVGAAGRTQLRVDADYELLLTNRWILQPRFEAQLAGKADVERQTGAGLMTTDVGLRLRYEIRRELAPYAGVMWRNKWQGTADLAEDADESTSGARFVTGLRVWW